LAEGQTLALYGKCANFNKANFPYIIMKKLHIVILLLIAVSIAVLISFMGDLSTYETIASARQKSGKTVTIIARIDRAQPIEYDPARDPNYLSFHISDTLGNTAKVVYHFEKPYDLEKAERITLKGRMNGDVFEITRKDGILLKCPSKYKDDPNAAKAAVSQN
jgi:cytochrome c-type biogenesis protein CcmE